jgi:hypothetical protein
MAKTTLEARTSTVRSRVGSLEAGPVSREELERYMTEARQVLELQDSLFENQARIERELVDLRAEFAVTDTERGTGKMPEAQFDEFDGNSPGCTKGICSPPT